MPPGAEERRGRRESTEMEDSRKPGARQITVTRHYGAGVLPGEQWWDAVAFQDGVSAKVTCKGTKVEARLAARRALERGLDLAKGKA